MPTAFSFSKHARGSSGLIWLGDRDPDGNPLHPEIKAVAYEKESDLIRYRAKEMTDEAEVASLIEKAVYETSRAAYKNGLREPGGYLYRTYKALVDGKLRKTVRAFGMENHLLDELVIEERAEDSLVKTLTRQQVFEAMDSKGRELWEWHLLGYELNELAAELGQTNDYVGKRLRRSTERALRRLVLRAER